jgi:hypothetical protein
MRSLDKGQENYTGMTCHWINKEWVMQKCNIACIKHIGTTNATAVTAEINRIADDFEIKEFAAVTDTALNMCSVGTILQAENKIWHGCADHIIKLTTKIEFDDNNFQAAGGVMKAARNLIGFFNYSTQANDMLLSRQDEGRRVTVVNDVATRWWSTYAAVERLIRLEGPIISLCERTYSRS